MADVTAAFLGGQQAAQAEQLHEQQVAENKFRLQVLKHEQDRIKLQDAESARNLAIKHAELGIGQEDANQPQSGIPSVVANLIRNQQASAPGASVPAPGGATAPIDQPPAAPQAPQASLVDRVHQLFNPTAAAPAAPAPAIGTAAATGTGAAMPSFQAQARFAGPADAASGAPPLVLHHEDALPSTHAALDPGVVPSSFGKADHPDMKASGHVWLPPIQIPAMGVDVPGMWYSARAAAEESSRRAIALKLAEQPLHNVGPEETAIARTATGAVPVYTNPNSRGNTPQEQYIAALKKGDDAGAKVILQGIKDTQRPGAQGSLESMLLAARRDGDTKSAALIQGVMRETANARRDPTVAADREETKSFREDMQLYTQDVANGWKKHADALKEYNDPLKHPENLDPATAKEAPAYEPPSFADWRAAHPGGAAGTGKPAAPGAKGASKKPATIAEAAPVLKGQKPGRYTLTDGSVWRVKADGSVAAAQ